MKFTVEYNPDFFNDIVQAVDWYNEKQAGLGKTLHYCPAFCRKI